MSFRAYRVSEENGQYVGQWQELDEQALPAGDILIEVHYSSLNYKDALSASGHKGVTKAYPHTPGIDAAGIVLEGTADFPAGSEVVVFGYDLGMNTAGGFAEKIRVPASWVLHKPQALSMADSMAWGTAGFTAALSVQKLLAVGVAPEKGAVVVTGATGGVGSVAVALLAKLGFEVLAVTGKAAQADFLQALGAKDVLSRETVLAAAGKALAKPLYQAALDTTGGDMVSALLPQIQNEGALSTCGMLAGTQVSTSIFPFILRGVSLLGVDSVEIPRAEKQRILDKVASDWALPNLNSLTVDVTPEQLSKSLERIRSGQGVGRYRLKLN